MGRRWSTLVAIGLLLLSGAAWFIATASQSERLSGGDPDGILVRALKLEASRLSTTTSSFGTIITRPPTVDSCDGRSGTEGWTGAAAIFNTPVDAVPQIEAKAIARGWIETLRTASPYESRWKKEVGGRSATLSLLTDPGDPAYFKVAITAYPPGPTPPC